MTLLEGNLGGSDEPGAIQFEVLPVADAASMGPHASTAGEDNEEFVRRFVDTLLLEGLPGEQLASKRSA